MLPWRVDLGAAHAIAQVRTKYADLRVVLAELASAASEDRAEQQCLAVWRARARALYECATKLLTQLASAPECEEWSGSDDMLELCRPVEEKKEVLAAVSRLTAAVCRTLETYSKTLAGTSLKMLTAHMDVRAPLVQAGAHWRYVLAVLGPTGVAVSVAGVVGLMCTGWGALIVASGLVVSGVCVWLLRRHDARANELDKTSHDTPPLDSVVVFNNLDEALVFLESGAAALPALGTDVVPPCEESEFHDVPL